MLRVAALAGMLLAGAVPGQTPSGAAGGFPELVRDLTGVTGPRREARIQVFLQRAPSGSEDALRGRLLLATELLRRFALKRAAREFDQVLADTLPRHRALRARALYGRAQCAELSRAHTGEYLRHIVRDYPDLRYGRYAAAALSRLARKQSVRLGQPAPSVPSFRDLAGRVHSLDSFRGHAVLLIFVAPYDERSLTKAKRLLKVWQQARMDPNDAIVFAIDSEASQLRELARQQEWLGPVVACTGAFLESPVLEFAVRALPDAFLIGPDGLLLSRSPSTSTLRDAVKLLRGG